MMLYRLSAKEINFLCVVFQHPLPLIVRDPFEISTKKQIQEEWELFCEKFTEKGLFKTDTVGGIEVDEQLSQTMMCCFGADMMISIIEKEQINHVFYINSGQRMLLSKINNNEYDLQLYKNENKFNNEFLRAIHCNHTNSIKESEPFVLEVPLKQFERLLEWYDGQKNKEIANFCLENRVNYDICMMTLRDIHLSSGETVLTERINDPGTILTKISHENGVARLAKSIYSENGDLVTLMQCETLRLPSVVIDFMKG
ncbi:hypothetical protein QFZ81_000158 [Paenibacillus sp. V4I9]|uniref:hypothetical protein n=1 Tax=Paenibacillus sp. V4I9 TaxID=3042308 RepID=UPI00277E40CD|nr:hypothetical protein [Paenibacillus sp. V4I9]MDQ0885070.1 hypothetical protein [Paenibacillus sp. V4I9]